ncbi:uncharacterized protein LOC116198723 [Punica granatum]|uniref:Uncharacterized protein n=2 Tax=Punica granatum TaxID=22663 RepID=A0A218WAS4_PUNGR|nr:uncharacterized protein LOC116198723 [Punica granatum]OWM69558.1 hypothetical protein CDL15_Pgr014019 [Punica granatum]PKI40803.1 hypothetical protein CRG98_038814 [Punica granatum]
MSMKLLGWLFLSLLCTQALYVLAVEGSSASTQRQEEARGFSLTDGLPQGGGLVRDKKQDMAPVSRKSGKGKGAYGGANVVHRPNPRASAAPALVGPSFVISVLLLVSLGFILA